MIPKNIQRVVSSSLTREMAFCFIYQNSKFRDVGPRRYKLKAGSKVINANFKVLYDAETGQQGGDHGPDAEDNYWEIETGGRGILSNLADSSYFVWVSNVTSSDDALNGDVTYCERPSSTPIWKFTTHGDSVGESTPSFIHRDNSSTLTRVHCTTSIEDGGTHLVGFTKKGTTLRYFVDGVFTNEITISGNDTLTTDDPSIGVDLTEVSSTGLNEYMFSHYGWARALSDLEARSLYDLKTRWDMFSKPNLIAFVAAVGGAFTLVAESGPYAYSGTAIELDKSSLISADTEQYTYSGTELALPTGFRLSAENGGYNYSGTDLSVKAGLILTVDTDQYSYSGTAVNLPTGFSLDAETAQYAYNGTELRIIQGVIAVNTGSYVYNGSVVALTVTGSVWTLKPDSTDTWTTKIDSTNTWTIQ